MQRSRTRCTELRQREPARTNEGGTLSAGSAQQSEHEHMLAVNSISIGLAVNSQDSSDCLHEHQAGSEQQARTLAVNSRGTNHVAAYAWGGGKPTEHVVPSWQRTATILAVHSHLYFHAARAGSEESPTS